MELRQLEHFVTVAQERHFTHAAELLQISQSGLSASIRALETELGAPLFVRSTRRVELTAAGTALLEESHRTLASAAAARDAVLAVRGVVGGSLSVGSEQCLGVVDVPRELARFRADHPGVRIRLGFAGSTALVADVAAGRLDLAVVAVCATAPAGVTLHTLAERELLLLCRQEDPRARAGSVSVEDLADDTFVGFQPDWAARVLADRTLAAVGLRHDVQLEVNDVHSLLDLVEAGLGVAVVPALIAAKRPDRLAGVRLTGEIPPWEVAVAVPDNPSPAAAAFLAQLGPDRA
ncbi:LysR family transcriptional regulator [Actinotalea sp.]|uniref:LysR family transcriptional regulator n=1 Tax=Actinotalea sp. TaxID=1872145 RepID=UPI00356A1D87